MDLVLGIDQGGTKTSAVLMDENGRILGSGKSKGAYFPDVGIKCSMAAMRAAVQEAMAGTGVPISSLTAVEVGMTGIDWPGQKEKLEAVVSDAFGVAETEVVNDSVIAMYGGTWNPYGAVVCAGTGMNIAALNPEGKSVILGFYIDNADQGGGALAARAMRKVFDAELGLCEPTKLRALFLEHFRKRTVDDLLYSYIEEPDTQTEARQLVPRIIQLASNGDNVTRQLLEQMARETGAYLHCALKKVGMERLPVDVVLTGSVFKGSENLLTEALTEYIRANCPAAEVINARYEPVVGAAIMGLLRKKAITPAIRENIEKTAAAARLIRSV
jgi:N-acetylglucosamine kinase-like BadF-type ATPase